jgi:hypothetical protein
VLKARTIYGGSTELLWVRVYDQNGNSLDGTNVQLAVTSEGVRPTASAWRDPDSVEHAGRLMRAGLLFEAPIPSPGETLKYSVYLRMGDGDEDIWTHCGSIVVS